MNTQTSALKRVIQTTPRVFLQGVEVSLEPKFQIMKQAVEEESARNGISLDDKQSTIATASILSTNPALLVTTNLILRSRLTKYLKHPSLSLTDAMQPRKVGRKRMFHNEIEETNHVNECSLPRKRRSVVEISRSGEDIRYWSTVQDAAKDLEVSLSSVYTACRKGKLVKGRTLKYAEDCPLDICIHNDSDFGLTALSENKIKLIDCFDVSKLNLMNTENQSKVSIIAFVSGGTYPSDDLNSARGRRRAGGLALHFPQVATNDVLNPKETIRDSMVGHIQKKLLEKFRLSVTKAFGMIMPEQFDGSIVKDGLILLGFPYLRPSRNRCDLYACHGAIKVVLQLLKQTSVEKDMRNMDVDIQICSDSSYSWKLLKNSQQVLRWGSASGIETFEFDGEGPRYLANPDLLFPLAKTMNRIVKSDVVDDLGKRLCLGRNITITFHHSEHVLVDKITGGYINHLSFCAKKTARWQFHKR